MPAPASSNRSRSGRGLRSAILFLLGGAGWASGPVYGSEPPTPRELVEVVDISAVSASPDGRHVVFRTDEPLVAANSYRLAWHMLDLETGEQREIGSAGQPIVNDPGLLAAEAPIWEADGRAFYYRALDRGEVQIWRAAADGSGSRVVTAEAGDVLSMEPAPDGAIHYRVGPPREEIIRAELEEYDSGILVDDHVELAQNLFRGAIVNGRHASQRLTGRFFARGGVLWARAPLARRLDLGSLGVADDPQPPSSQAQASTTAPEAVARSARGDVAVSVWNGAEGDLTVTRPGPAGARLSCPAAECRNERVTWVAWRPGRDELVFATSDRSLVHTLRAWDLGSGRVRSITRTNGQVSGGQDENSPCAVVERLAICVRAEPTSPPRLEAIDLDSGRARPLFDPNSALRARQWPRTERVTWQSAEGRQFSGVLFLPEHAPARPLPFFVNYYSCRGFLRGGVGNEWPFALLAANGIASMCVNATRTSGAQNGVDSYRAALGGIGTLIETLAHRGLVDRLRVGIGGLSFGTEVTLWGLFQTNLFAAASIATPQFEPASYWFNAVRGRDYHRILRDVWGLGAPEETPEQWRLLSAAFNTDRIRAPLLLQLAEQESRYAIELYARLSNSPTPTEMYVFPDEPHIKVQPRHRLAVYRRNLDWFRFWLQHHVDPDPEKAAQYRRWRALEQRAAAEARQRRQDRSQSSTETRSNSR